MRSFYGKCKTVQHLLLFLLFLTLTSASFAQLVTIADQTGEAAGIQGGQNGVAVLSFNLVKTLVPPANMTSIVTTFSSPIAGVFTNIHLWESADAVFTGADTDLGTLTIVAGNTYSITGLTRPMGAGTFYFIVVDVDPQITTAASINASVTSVQVIVDAGTTAGTTAVGPTYTAGLITQLTASVNANNGGLTDPLIGGTLNAPISGFRVATNGTQTINNVVFNVTTSATLASKLSNIHLKDDGANATYSLAGADMGAAVVSGVAPNYVLTFNTSTSVLSGVDTYYYLVADVPASTPTALGVVATLATVGVNRGYPSALAVTRTFDINALVANVTTNNGGAPATILAGATDQVLFGFNAKTNGTQSLNSIVFNVTTAANIASLLSNTLLKDDAGNTVYSNAGATIGTLVVSGSAPNWVLTFSGIAVPLSGADHYFYLVSDVPAAAPSTAGINVALASVGVSQGNPSSLAGFNRSFSISGLTTTVVEIAPATAPVMTGTILGAGSTANVLTGFSATSTGTQVLSAINFNISGLTAQLANVTLYRSTSAGTLGSAITTNATGNFDLTAVAAGNKTVNSTPVYYYLVADVANNVNTLTPSITIAPTAGNISIATGTVNAFTINRTLTFQPSQTSTIILNGGTTALINYRNNQSAALATNGSNSVSLGTFQVKEAPSDPDNTGTSLTSITFSVTNSAYIGRIGLFDGGTLIPGTDQPGAATVTFSGLALTAADNGGTKDFTVRANFTTAVADNQPVHLTVTNAAAAVTGTDFISATAGGASTTSAAPTNLINVVATTLAFVANPPNTGISANFALTVQALDGLGTLDVDYVNQIALTISGGNPTAVLSSASGPGVTPTTVGGQVIWTALRIDKAGTYSLKASDNAYGDPLGGDANGTVVISSSGVSVAPGSVALTPMCYSGIFQTLSNIVITENDPADFASGAGQIFSMVLPAGFVFDTSVTPLPTLGGTEIGTAVAASYVGNSIVRIGYSISGTTNINTITISGLKVKYTGTSPTSGNILRYGGSAVQAGNMDADGKNHGTLTANASATPVSFTVQELTGQPVQSPTETRFSINTASVKLIGNPLGGVFSGNGVILSPTNGYTFNPTSVGVGNNYIVVYTFTEPAGQQCQVTTQKTFEVYNSTITNLSLQYCTNDLPTGPLTVPQAQIDAQFGGPPGTWVLNDFVYYNPSFGYIPIATPNNLTFDPAAVDYQTTTSIYGGVYIYYRVRNTVTSSINFAQYQFVPIYIAPNVTIDPMRTAYCADETPIILKGTPPNSNNNVTDKFVATGNGAAAITPSGATWTFSPTLVSGVTPATSQTFTLQYFYRNPSTNCSNKSPLLPITVHARPTTTPVPDLAFTTLNTCVNGSAVTFTTSNPLTTYKWYDNATIAPINLLSQTPNFTPSLAQFDRTVPGTTNFYVTRTINGCESLAGLLLNAIVDVPATAQAGSDVTICQGNDVVFSTLSTVPAVGGSATAPGSVWTTSGTGTFVDAGGSPSNVFGVAVKYVPSGPAAGSDIALGSVTLTLTTDDPAGPCGKVKDDMIVTISKTALVDPGSPNTVCGTPGVPINLNGNISGGVVTGAWTTNGQGGFGPGNTSSTTSLLTTYNPSATELALGATVTFTLTSDDPDGPGPCPAAAAPVAIIIKNRAYVDAGPATLSVCATDVINVTGSIVTNSSATSTTWSGGTGSFTSPASLASTYNATAAEKTSGGSFNLTITSDDPAGPCPAETDNILLTIKRQPSPPTSLRPNPKYCVGDALQNLDATGNIGATINWYSTLPPALPTPPPSPFAIGSSVPPTGITTASPTPLSGQPFYATQTELGCESVPTTVTIVVHPLPAPEFSSRFFCYDPVIPQPDTEFDVKNGVLSTIPRGTIDKWGWDFGDGFSLPQNIGGVPVGTHSGNTNGTFPKPTHHYQGIGTFNVTLTAVSDQGCVASVSHPVTIGTVPRADFQVTDQCDKDVTKFNYTGTIPAQIAKYDWAFDDINSGAANALSVTGSPAAINATHTFKGDLITGVKTYNVSLTSTTNLGCASTIIKPTYILVNKKFIPNVDSTYIEGFETATHGWATEGQNASLTYGNQPFQLTAKSVGGSTSWQNSTPSGTVITLPPGEKAWFTYTFQANERSVLNGPCFQMDVSLPVLSVDYWTQLNPSNDGAYLEVSSFNTGTGLWGSWTRLGGIATGLKWYNQPGVPGLSQLNNVGQAVGQIGWSGFNGPAAMSWQTGKYNMDAFAGQRIKIRFVLGISGSGNPSAAALEGFAIDNVRIEKRNRVILAENFTSQLATGAAQNNTNFANYKSANPNELVKLQYHVDLPAADDINKQNPADPNARAGFYGLTNSTSIIPRIFLDGVTDAPGNFVGAAPGSYIWANNLYDGRSLVASDLHIGISTLPANPGFVKVQVNVKPLTTITSGKLSLIIAVIEKTVGAETFVVRKLLPSAIGIDISLPLVSAAGPAGIRSYVETWEIKNFANVANMGIVAFVQDRETHDVLQAGYKSNPAAASVIAGVEDIAGRTIAFPNPADREVTLQLPSAAKQFMPVRVTDQMGKLVGESGIKEGEKEKIIRTADLAAGMYIIQIETSSGTYARTKMIVVHEK